MNSAFDQLKRELDGKVVAGPAVVPAPEPFAMDIHPGLQALPHEFILKTRDREWTTPLLQHKVWPPDCLTDLFLHDDCPFSLSDRSWNRRSIGGRVFLRLTHVIDQIYGAATNLPDILQFLSSLVGFLPHSARAPLKVECRLFPNRTLADRGFVVSGIKANPKNIVVRLAWLFPREDAAKRGLYLPAGGVRLTQVEGNIFGKAEWMPPYAMTLQPLLRSAVIRLVSQPAEVLSDAGRERAMDVFLWSKGVPSPRRKIANARLAFVRSHEELWKDPRSLARLLVREGLYSAKTMLSDVEIFCRRLAEQARKGAGIDLTPKVEAGARSPARESTPKAGKGSRPWKPYRKALEHALVLLAKELPPPPFESNICIGDWVASLTFTQLVAGDRECESLVPCICRGDVSSFRCLCSDDEIQWQLVLRLECALSFCRGNVEDRSTFDWQQPKDAVCRWLLIDFWRTTALHWAWKTYSR